VNRAVTVVLIFGPHEWGFAALRLRSGNRFDILKSDKRVELIEVPALDHSMFDRHGRARVKDSILALLHERTSAERTP
jgi:hypothetical protein